MKLLVIWICECRIWNRVLTAEEIQAKNHFYYVDPKSEGLVAYWKFDEGQGVSITDYANENNLTAAIEYIKSHPRWRLSLQTHKIINIR